MTDSDLVPAATATLFPKAYLLSIYTAAIEQGFIWITPLQRSEAASLRGKLHRLRRRSDTSNKSFITPQHHLVSFGEWEPGPDGEGRMAAVYDSRSSTDVPLPRFERTDGSVIPQNPFAQRLTDEPPNDFAPSLPPELAAAASTPLSAESIDDFVSRMQRSAEAREDDDDE